MTSRLFTPIALRELTLDNRIMVSPMCQYSAADGCATDWHLMHLGQFSVSGAGLLMVEMTNVEARGRISPYCMGLYSDANEAALKKVVDFCRKYGNAKLGIQIAHAGRKASTAPPWQGRKALTPEEGGWQTVAPSTIPMYPDDPVPRALTRDEIKALVQAFAAATQRADRIGFDVIEIHAAHGYLLHEFLSPISNRREDEYGGACGHVAGEADRCADAASAGPLENRMRFPLEVFAAMRAAWPAHKPMGIRVSTTDWVEGGWTPEETVIFARQLKKLGCDWIDVSSGGLAHNQVIPVGPGYHAPFAEKIRKETGIATICVGLITQPRQAEEIIAKGQADMVSLARGMLYDPRWAWHAARELGAEAHYPNQYLRCKP